MKRALLVLLVSGCTTVGPDYKRPEISLPAQFPAPTTPEQVAIQSDWWTLYSDPTLNDLIASARANNADLRVANWLGFFVERINGNNVFGRITPILGVIDEDAGPAPAGVFPQAIRLVE